MMYNEEVIAEVERLVQIGSGVEPIHKALAHYNGTYHYRVLVGREQGVVDGVPQIISAFQTPEWGKYYFYKRSTADIGASVIYKGVRFTVMVNESRRGDGTIPSIYYFLALNPHFHRLSPLTKTHKT